MPIISGGSGGGAGGLVRLLSVTRATTGALDTGASAIATGHGMLRVVILARSAAAAATEAFSLRFNADSGANYDSAFQQGSSGGTSGTSIGQTAITAAGLWTGNTETANYAAAVILDLPFYDNTTWFKAGLLMFQTSGTGAANVRQAQISVGWRSTVAINQITFDSTAHLLTNSTMTVYGTA